MSLIQGGLEPRSINRKISALRAFFKFHIQRGDIKQNPMVKIKGMKTPQRLPQYAEEHEMKKIFEGMEFPEGYTGSLDRLILQTFYVTGIRRSELLNLRWSDIDEGQLRMKVLGKGNKERYIPMFSEHVESLRALKSEQHELGIQSAYIFLEEDGKQISTGKLYQKVRRYLGMVSRLQKKSPHVLRHSFATHLMNNGAQLNAVKELLGHSSLAATQVYTHNSIQQLKEIYKQAHPKS